MAEKGDDGAKEEGGYAASAPTNVNKKPLIAYDALLEVLPEVLLSKVLSSCDARTLARAQMLSQAWRARIFQHSDERALVMFEEASTLKALGVPLTPSFLHGRQLKFSTCPVPDAVTNLSGPVWVKHPANMNEQRLPTPPTGISSLYYREDFRAYYDKLRDDDCKIDADDEDMILIVALYEQGKDGRRVPVIEMSVPIESLAADKSGTVGDFDTGLNDACAPTKTRHYQVKRTRMTADHILQEQKDKERMNNGNDDDDSDDDDDDDDDFRSFRGYPSKCTKGVFPSSLQWKENEDMWDLENGFVFWDQSSVIKKYVYESWRADRAAVAMVNRHHALSTTIHAYRPANGKMACLLDAKLQLENEITEIQYL